MLEYAKDEKAIFLAALEQCTSQGREAYLQSACRDDAELLKRVKVLLSVHEESEGPLDLRAPGPGTEASLPVAEQPGAIIGPYNLLEQIGEGGFGLVFMAEQQRPVRRTVAVKVLKPGMDSLAVIARFEAERQALALMDHPNIARVLDAGETPAGRPHFVMELVRGIPITDFCDQNGLAMRERLDLFVSVCAAVQHAHQKGIIHRDIKPSNVLVTMQDDKPLVKVIDFGIAKAIGQPLTDKTLTTGADQMIGTPLYMSPEQAQMGGLDVDTRTDVYSLGVLLYELVTGTTPFDKVRLREVGYDEMRRIIREEEPPRPSTRLSTLGHTATTRNMRKERDLRQLSRLLRGELDWIVMRAMEKDRQRRYDSVSALADDARRYLHDEPVVACPPSRWYRFRKFARRHRGGLVTSLVAATALVAMIGTIGGSIGWVARDQAARDAVVLGQANAALDATTAQLERANWPESGAALGRAESLLAAANLEAPVRVGTLKRDLGMAQRLEEIYDQPDEMDGRSNPSKRYARYREVFKEYGLDLDALQVEEATERIHARPIRLEIARALDSWALAGIQAEPRGTLALLAIAKAADPDPWRGRLRDAIKNGDAAALEALAASADVPGLPPQTLDLLGRALNMHKATKPQAAQLLLQAQLKYPGDFWINCNLADVSANLLQFDNAVRSYAAALALRPNNPWLDVRLGRALIGQKAYRQAIAQLTRALERNPKDAGALRWRAVASMYLGRKDEAIADFSRAIAAAQGKTYLIFERGTVYTEIGKYDLALADYGQAMRMYPNKADIRRWRGFVFSKLEQWDKAIAEYAEAIRLDPQYALAYHDRGSAYRRKSQWKEALADLTRAIELNSRYAESLRQRAGIYRNLKQWDNALADYDRITQLGADTAADWTMQGDTREKLGKRAQAFEDYAVALRKDAKYVPALLDRSGAAGMVGRWDQAAADLAIVVKLWPAGTKPWTDLASYRAALGEAAGYRDAVKEALARFGQTKDPIVAQRVALACLLMDTEGTDQQASADLAELAATRLPKDMWSRIALGAALYRTGQVKEADREFHGVLQTWPENPAARPGTAPGPTVTLLWLAITSQRLGQTEEARRWLNRAAARLDREKAAVAVLPTRDQSHVWAICAALRREAAASLATGAKASPEKKKSS